MEYVRILTEGRSLDVAFPAGTVFQVWHRRNPISVEISPNKGRIPLDLWQEEMGKEFYAFEDEVEIL